MEGTMRKVIVAEFISLDGVIDAPHEMTSQYSSSGLESVRAAAIDGTDTLLLGRVTYEEMASYWSSRAQDDDPVAAHMNKPKLVASTTLEHGNGWGPTTIIGGNLVESLTALKQQAGKDILCIGSAQLVRSLLPVGVVDELRLIIYPVIAGRGKRLFSEGVELQLELNESRPLGAGVTYLSYAPRAVEGADG
jgi:dihydrofolate reductase